MTVTDTAAVPELTFAMIKPDAFERRVVGRVLSRIEDEQFTIRRARQLTLCKDDAEQFYREHAERAFYPRLVEFMTSGPVMAMVLERTDAVKHWRAVMGATDSRKAGYDTLRERHGDKTGLAVWRNVVHGSDSPEVVVRETAFFFSAVQVSAVLLRQARPGRYTCKHCSQWYMSTTGTLEIIGPCPNNGTHEFIERTESES